MLSNIFWLIRWVGLRTSDASKRVYVTWLYFTRDPINNGGNIIWIKSVSFYSDQLVSSCVSRDLIYRIYNSNCFGLVASRVIIAASPHCWLLVESIPYSEPKINIGGSAWSDCSHDTLNLRLLIGRQHSILLNKSFKIDSVPIDSNFCKRKFW
jgi:hypothetical protein